MGGSNSLEESIVKKYGMGYLKTERQGTGTSILINMTTMYVLSAYGLEVIDITDPQEPASMSNIEWQKLGIYNKIHSAHTSLALKNQYLICCCWGLRVVDISDPTDLKVCGDVFNSETTRSFGDIIINPLNNDHAYVAGGSGFRVLDVSELPVIRPLSDTIKTGVLSNDVHTDKAHIYHQGKIMVLGEQDNVYKLLLYGNKGIVAISVPVNNPKETVAHIDHKCKDEWFNTNSSLGKSLLQDDTIFAYSSRGISVIDCKDYTWPKEIAQFDSKMSYRCKGNAMCVIGKYLIMAGSAGIEIYDYSDPIRLKCVWENNELSCNRMGRDLEADQRIPGVVWIADKYGVYSIDLKKVAKLEIKDE